MTTLLTIAIAANTISVTLGVLFLNDPPWRKIYPPGLYPEVRMIVGAKGKERV